MATSGKEAIQYIDEKQGEVQYFVGHHDAARKRVETLAEIRKHEKFRREHLEPGHEEEEPIKVIAVTALKHGELLSLCESTGGWHSVMFGWYIETGDFDKDSRRDGDGCDYVCLKFAFRIGPKTRKINNNNNNNNNNNSTKNLATLRHRRRYREWNSDGGSGGSDPITDGGGSGGRGGSNEGTDTRNKGATKLITERRAMRKDRRNRKDWAQDVREGWKRKETGSNRQVEERGRRERRREQQAQTRSESGFGR